MTDTPSTLTLTLETGDVVIKLRPDLAPGHVAHIAELANEGFYNGLTFHRVIPGFMAQGGCPNGTGMGGSKKPNLKAEFSKQPHVRGVASMARSSNPDSANSASSSSASTMPASSTTSTPSGAKSPRAWSISTRCPRVSRRVRRARS